MVWILETHKKYAVLVSDYWNADNDDDTNNNYLLF